MPRRGFARRPAVGNACGVASRALVAGLVAITSAACGATVPPPEDPSEAELNPRVLDLIATYPAGGFGGYAWPAPPGTAGTTRDLAVGTDVIAHGGPGNHCVGITLEVLWRALAECPGGVDAALTAATAPAFKRVWYVPAVGGAGSAEALPAFGLGARLALADARPGDFVQAWRFDGLGHSMVFLGWDRDAAGTITGIRYWSSQPWTDGIGESSTAVGAGDGAFDPAQIYIARARCRR
jgi:hypothetical protein